MAKPTLGPGRAGAAMCKTITPDLHMGARVWVDGTIDPEVELCLKRC